MANNMSMLDYGQVIRSSYDDASGGLKTVPTGGTLVGAAYDYLALTYVPSGNGAGQIQTVTYKSGGASGTTVATLTLVYDASNNLSTVTKS